MKKVTNDKKHYIYNRLEYMRNLLLILTFSGVLNAGAQEGYWELADSLYKHYKKEKMLDSTLIVARQMNEWALKNETDTSLRYAVSFRKIGVGYIYKELKDSALYYFNLDLYDHR